MARSAPWLHVVRALAVGDSSTTHPQARTLVTASDASAQPLTPPQGRAGAWIVAVIAPGAIVLAWLALGGFFAPDAVAPPPSEVSLQLSAGLANDPDVIVLGNSQAYAAIDPAALRTALDSGPVGAITIANARPYLLYKLLDHHVFRAGARPRLVIVPIGWDHLVSALPPRPDQELTWATELADAAPDVDARILGRAGPATGLQRVQRASMAAKDALLDAVTSLPAVLSGAGNPSKAIDEARQAVMGDATLGNAALAVRMIPVVEDAPVAAVDATRGDDVLDRSLLPDLAELVAAHGARLVIVSLPQRRDDLRLTAANERALLAWAQAHDAAYVDLASAPVAVTEWRDEGHVVRAVAQRLTALLAERLLALGALGDGPMQAGRIASQPDSIARTGTIPPVPSSAQVVRGPEACELLVHLPDDLAPLGDTQLLARDLGAASPLVVTYAGTVLEPQVLQRAAGACDGTYGSVGADVRVRTTAPEPDPTALSLSWTDDVVWPTRTRRITDERGGTITWVPPGTGITWTLHDRSALGPGVTVAIAAIEVVHGSAPPVVRIDDVPVPVDHVGDLWRADATAPGDSGPLAVSIQAPPDGWLVVRALTVRHGDDVDAWVGSPQQTGDSAILAGTTTARIQSADDTRDVGGAVVDEGDTLRLDLPPAIAVASADKLIARFGTANFGVCTPVGVVSRGGDATFARAVAWRPDRPTIPRPAAAPAGVAWDLVLQPARGCFSNTWVYPGESATFSPASPGGLASGARFLELQWGVFAPGDAATVRVVLRANGRALLDELVQVTATDSRLVLALDPPVPASPDQLSLELASPGQGFVFVRQAAVSYDAPEAPVSMDAPPPAPDAVVVQAPTPGRVTADLLAGDDVVASLKVFPPDHATVTAGDGGVVLAIADGGFTRVCAPIAAVDGDATILSAVIEADDAAPRFLSLELGWFRGSERLLDDAGRPAIVRARADLTSGSPTTVGARFDVPDGATHAVPCLVRTKGEPGTITLAAWTLGEP